MNFREIFEQAFSDIYRTYHASDNDIFCGAIREKAANTKSAENGTKFGTLTEISVPQTSAKKHGNAPVIAAASVLAAAAIGGTVFSLNTYGGLRSSEVTVHDTVTGDARGAASGNSAAPMSAETAKAVNGVTHMDVTCVIGDGVTAHFTGYEFDSAAAMFYYDIIYAEGTEHATGIPLRPMGINGVVMHGCSGEYDEEDANVMHVRGTVAVKEPSDSAFVSFGSGLSDLTDMSYTTDDALITLSVVCDPDSVIKIHRDLPAFVAEGKPARIDDIYITPTHITICWRNCYGISFKEFGAYPDSEITMRDGSVLIPHYMGTVTEDDGEHIWVLHEFDEPVDISQIKEFVLGSAWIYGDEYNKQRADTQELLEIRGIEHSPLYTPADEWFDWGEYKVHVIGYTFDTVILRLRFEIVSDRPLRTIIGSVPQDEIPMPFPVKMPSGKGESVGGYHDDTRDIYGIVTSEYMFYAYEPCDTFEVPFGDGIFTAHYNESVPKLDCKTDKELEFDWGESVHFDGFVLTSGNLSIMLSGSPYTYDYSSDEGMRYMKAIGDLTTVITMKNGEDIIVSGNYAKEPVGCIMPDGHGYKFYQFIEPIDISDVASINVNGIELYNTEEAPDSSGDDSEITDEAVGIDDMTGMTMHFGSAEITPTAYTFDGNILQFGIDAKFDGDVPEIIDGLYLKNEKMVYDTGCRLVEKTGEHSGKYIWSTSPRLSAGETGEYTVMCGEYSPYGAGTGVKFTLSAPSDESVVRRINTDTMLNDTVGINGMEISRLGAVLYLDGSTADLGDELAEAIITYADGSGAELHNRVNGRSYYDPTPNISVVLLISDIPLDTENIASVEINGVTVYEEP